MLTISYEGKSRKLDGKKRVILEIRGLSTDEKPSDILKCQYIDNGSVFIEIDTGYVYLYDLVGDSWYNVTSPIEETDETEETEATPEASLEDTRGEINEIPLNVRDEVIEPSEKTEEIKEEQEGE